MPGNSLAVALWSCAALALLGGGCVAPHPDLPPARIGTESHHRPSPPPPPVLPPRGTPVTQQAAVLQPTSGDIVALQVMLDRANLSPGVMDGTLGSRTRTALRAWQQQRGMPATGEPDADTLKAVAETRDVLVAYTVAEQDHEGLAPVPSSWLGRSQVSQLGYETVLERIAEAYHCSQALLRRLNPDCAWPNPPPGTVLTAPNPRPFRSPRAASLHISLGQKTIRAYDAEGRLIALFPCSIAKDREKRPTGELKVISAAENPNYYFDPAVFPEDPEAQTLGRKLVIPSGPNNPVGVAWISLSLPGYGIHGTPHPEDIGKTESHGCFRLANWNATRLLKMISIGIPVIIEE